MRKKKSPTPLGPLQCSLPQLPSQPTLAGHGYRDPSNAFATILDVYNLPIRAANRRRKKVVNAARENERGKESEREKKKRERDRDRDRQMEGEKEEKGERERERERERKKNM